jgi:hypothetical protein
MLFEFQDYCKENKTIALCMPSYLSHLLQPLDIHYISRETFLPAFKLPTS